MVDMRRININRDGAELFNLISTTNETIFPNQIKCANVDTFQHWLSKQLEGFFHELYIIEEKSDTNAIIGYALSYDYRAYDRHCLLCIYSTKDIEKSLWAYFISELFREYPLNKIFWEVVVSNKKYLNLASVLGFSEEMILKEYKYQDGQYQNVCVLSMYLEDYRKG